MKLSDEFNFSSNQPRISPYFTRSSNLALSFYFICGLFDVDVSGSLYSVEWLDN
jgi:hypothetical protein